MRSLFSALLVVLVLTSAPALAFPPTITMIVKEGDVVGGVGSISSGFGACENMAVNNSGDWLVESDTNNADTNIDGVILSGNGHGAFSLYQQEGAALASPPGASIDSWDSIRINNLGNASFNNFLDGTAGTTDDSGVYYNGDLVIQEGTIATAPGFSAGTPYIGWFETYINDNNDILMVASIDDPAIASTVDRALVKVNGLSLTETLYAKEGDSPVAGRFIADFGTGPHTTAFNNAGYALYSVDMDGTTNDDGLVVYSNGTSSTILARESQPVAGVPGRNWEVVIGASLDVNNFGDWVMIANMDGATTDDNAIIRNGTDVIAREGSSLPSIAGGWALTAFGTGSVLIDAKGDVVWFGDWNDPDTTKDTGIFMNDQLIVQEGVTMVGGLLVTSISAVQDNMAMSDNGQWIIFEGVLNGTIEGAFLVEVPEPGTIALVAVGGLLLVRRRRRA
ncbi:MAG TPA: PEP-CTERM sorting domain-containing protein [Phycisphaerae bacterium]|nr:PEP-CTERM sorting domain-containing protein [Phycisphaerae bacterium]